MTGAEIDRSNGNLRAARRTALLAWELQRDGLRTGHDERGSALELLIEIDDALGATGRAFDELAELAEVWEPGPRGSEADGRIARYACMAGRCSVAEPYIVRLEKRAGPESPTRLHARLYRAWSHLQQGQLHVAQGELMELWLALARPGVGKDPALHADLAAVAVLAGIVDGQARETWEPALAEAIRLYEGVHDRAGQRRFVATLREVRKPTCEDKNDTQDAIVRLLDVFDASMDDDTIPFSAGHLASPKPEPVEVAAKPLRNEKNWAHLQCLLRHQGRTMLHAMTSFEHPKLTDDVESDVARATVMIVAQGQGTVDADGRFGLSEPQTLATRLKLCAGEMSDRELAGCLVPEEDRSCTGLWVGRNTVLTLRHCVSNLSAPQFVVFDHRTLDWASAVGRKVSRAYCGDEEGDVDISCGSGQNELWAEPDVRKREAGCGSGPFEAISDGGVDDWALLVFEEGEFPPPPGAPVSRERLAERPPGDGDTLVSLGYPRGRPLLVSPRSALVANPKNPKNPRNVLVRTSIRAATGSSGSPVYNRSDEKIVGFVKRAQDGIFYDCDPNSPPTCLDVIRCTVAQGCGTSDYYPIMPLLDRLCLNRSRFDGSPDLTICTSLPK